MGLKRKNTAFVVYQRMDGTQKVKGAGTAEEARRGVDHNRSMMRRWPGCGVLPIVGIWKLKKS